MPGRLVLLATSGRVVPGLLSWTAWSVLREADEVYVAAADHPLMSVLASSGVSAAVAPVQSLAALADFLAERAGPSSVVWLAAPDADAELAALAALAAGAAGAAGAPAEAREALASSVPRREGAGAPVELVAGSWDLPGAGLIDLVAVMDRLRSPGGCPWDAAQTHESLLPYLIEETYETVEAIETADLAGLREELGDLLLQVVFHARVAQEHHGDPWSIDDVAQGIVTKLLSRHPHVFAGAAAGDADDLEQSWDQLKRAEKQRSSAVDGIPLAQPALALAAKLIARATRSGVFVEIPDVPSSSGALAERGGAGPASEDVGAALLALVAKAQVAGVDPEAALRAAARSYARQVRAHEGRAQEGRAQEGRAPAAGTARAGVAEVGVVEVGVAEVTAAAAAGEIASAP